SNKPEARASCCLSKLPRPEKRLFIRRQERRMVADNQPIPPVPLIGIGVTRAYVLAAAAHMKGIQPRVHCHIAAEGDLSLRYPALRLASQKVVEIIFFLCLGDAVYPRQRG